MTFQNLIVNKKSGPVKSSHRNNCIVYVSLKKAQPLSDYQTVFLYYMFLTEIARLSSHKMCKIIAKCTKRIIEVYFNVNFTLFS